MYASTFQNCEEVQVSGATAAARARATHEERETDQVEVFLCEEGAGGEEEVQKAVAVLRRREREPRALAGEIRRAGAPAGC